MTDANADGFGGGVDGAEGDGRAGWETGFGAGRGGDRAGDIGGVADARQAFDVDHGVLEPGIPVSGGVVVERGEVRRGVAVDDVLAGEPEDDIAAGAVDFGGAGEEVGFVITEPANLGADGLRVEGHAAEAENFLLAEGLVEVVDFGGSTGIDTVEDAGAEGFAFGVDREHAGADGADGHGPDVAGGVLASGEFASNDDDIVPPECVGVVFGPTGVGEAGVVFEDGGGEDVSIGRAEDALGAGCADVDSEQQ